MICEAFNVCIAALPGFRRCAGESLASFNPSAIARSMGVGGSLPGAASGKIVHHLPNILMARQPSEIEVS
ncbi:hypothetical protein XCV0508 [Xanthomonas euvesicatoria pv. vesicatoria str. 85-10]|uniref:Uncharacterized protein n=1 Tax=Xanthomonas euvesicatoria pv. vesicatoria (strain 85-10) TaxID=316273 RepID=Q3BYC4_XANE5|nr:hypothetical protein XCV0508 [Xanthomonas euvesicatoria pv. vesicatoria str. 85-10]